MLSKVLQIEVGELLRLLSMGCSASRNVWRLMRVCGFRSDNVPFKVMLSVMPQS